VPPAVAPSSGLPFQIYDESQEASVSMATSSKPDPGVRALGGQPRSTLPATSGLPFTIHQDDDNG